MPITRLVGSLSRIGLAAACAAGTLVIAPTAAAAVRPCVPGTERPVCHVWTGKVVSVGDGDTIDVDVFGDGTGRFWRVRVTGIQAMELTRYSHTASLRRGACHAREATRRMERLVLHRRVKLLAQDPSSYTGERRRPRRAVLVRRGGRWVDPAKVLVREGHALWLPNGTEYAWNNRYRALSLRAAARHRKLFNRAYCRRGPASASALKLSVRWDADGVDGDNISGEFGRVRNLGNRRIRLGGWRFRDSYLRHYTIPHGTVLRPGRRLTIHVGSGSRREGHLFWGLSAPAFENATHDRRGVGDGAYLFDRDGDLRAWAIYPCASGCAQPGDGGSRDDEPHGKPDKPKHGGWQH